jgi:hypothetical protein
MTACRPARSLLACALLGCLTGCAVSGDPPGRYPPPTTRYQGLTAAQWGERARGADPQSCRTACAALSRLRAEGIPFLLEAARHQEGSAENLNSCLASCNGALVDREDLARVVPYLGQEYAGYDAGAFPVRRSALALLGQAGPKAKGCVAAVKRLTWDPAVGRDAERTLKSIAK